MLQVRAITDAEREAWCRLAGEAADRCSHRSGLLELGAFSGAELRAGLRGYFQHPQLFTILVRAGVSEADSAFLLAALRDQLNEKQAELLAWEPEPESVGALISALPAVGFTLRSQKLFVERDLTAEIEKEWLTGITWASLAACGEEAFVALLSAAAVGDPFEDSSADPDTAFAELKTHAGPAFEPRGWLVAWYQGEPCGVVLPQRYHDEPDSGTIFYIGVLPDFRGRRIGRHLHREGLRLLRHMGVKRYKGSTDERNTAMAGIFTANGCTVTKTQYFFMP